jgi:hypothetical protein
MKAHVTLFAGVGIQDSWRELEYCVRTGEPAFRKDAPDDDPFTRMAGDPEAAANFDKAMATFAPQTAAAVAAAYDFSVFQRLMDVGGVDGVPAGADAILLKHVIHDWNDERAARIPGVCRAVLPASGRLLIAEGLYPAKVDRSLECRAAAANDVNMLVCTGGRQRSEAEFLALFEQAGFALSRIVPTPARVAVIEGVPS